MRGCRWLVGRRCMTKDRTQKLFLHKKHFQISDGRITDFAEIRMAQLAELKISVTICPRRSTFLSKNFF